eukprot:265598-Amphidinium_carterae.1
MLATASLRPVTALLTPATALLKAAYVCVRARVSVTMLFPLRVHPKQLVRYRCTSRKAKMNFFQSILAT